MKNSCMHPHLKKNRAFRCCWWEEPSHTSEEIWVYVCSSDFIQRWWSFIFLQNIILKEKSYYLRQVATLPNSPISLYCVFFDYRIILLHLDPYWSSLDPWERDVVSSYSICWWNQSILEELVRSHKCIVFDWYYSDSTVDSNTYPILYWCHDGKHIVPVIVQVWDCLSSPLRTDLVQERVGDGSVGAIDISRSRCSGLSGYKSSALLKPVWF